jgi:hypothetical protein
MMTKSYALFSKQINIYEPFGRKRFFFLDRGFRDTVTLLREDFVLNVIIPHCQQNDNKGEYQLDYDADQDEPRAKGKNDPLTCSQSADAQKCAKVRSMVEKVFSIIKKNKSLDFVLNSVIGQLGIDLRNACAMYNFTSKPTLYDKRHTEEVAKRL